MAMASIDYQDIGESEKILLAMHNLCIVRPEISWPGKEIAKHVPLSESTVLQMLTQLENKGYVKSFMESGNMKYYLSNTGIIKVSTLFT
jgi:DNA-binding MarR family transcriptional regulator